MTEYKYIFQGLSELVGWNITSDDLFITQMSISNDNIVNQSNYMGTKQYFPSNVGSSTLDLTIRFIEKSVEDFNLPALTGLKGNLYCYMMHGDSMSSETCIVYQNCFASSINYHVEPKFFDCNLSVKFDSYESKAFKYEPPIEEKLRKLGF